MELYCLQLSYIDALDDIFFFVYAESVCVYLRRCVCGCERCFKTYLNMFYLTYSHNSYLDINIYWLIY